MELPSRAPLPPPEKSLFVPDKSTTSPAGLVGPHFIQPLHLADFSNCPTPYAGAGRGLEKKTLYDLTMLRVPHFPPSKSGALECESDGRDLVTPNSDVESDDIHTYIRGTILETLLGVRVYPSIFYINMKIPKDKDGMQIDRRRALTNDREMNMVASEAGGKCKKHPEQEQLPGVCSACLRERLYQLYGCCKSQQDNKSTTVNMMMRMGVSSCSSSLSSCSPPYSSASSSTHISPNHHRGASEVSAKIAMVIAGAHAHAHAHEGGLKKSRSIAVVPTGGGGGDGKTRTRTKKGGFWSKLIGSKSKGAAFMHSSSRGRSD